MYSLKVIIPKLNIPELDYNAPDDILCSAGDLVVVPFRNQEITGIVVDTHIVSNIKNLRIITAKLDYKIPSLIIDFMYRAAKYYMANLGSITKLVLPIEIVGGRENKSLIEDIANSNLETCNLAPLSEEQKRAFEEIKSTNIPSVLKGITGSGKTEVYFHMIEEVIKSGHQALLMLPEIALSAQIIERFKSRFGISPVVWNSTITKSKKRNLLKEIISGNAKVIIGTRSALFLPYKNLNLIVVDEEHDSSYKQEEGVLYNARDMAVMRAMITGCKVLLSSATPSIETIYNVNLGKYHLSLLHNRFGIAILPEVKVIDMRLQKIPKSSFISNDLKEAIRNALDRKEQSIVFLNRRGYAPMMLCRSCGHRITCTSCSSWLVMHKSKEHLECHHCGYKRSLPNICSECGQEDGFIACGPGVERVAEEMQMLFPQSRIQIATKDEMKSEHDIEHILKRIENHEIDILIGTQVITKGYHFPKISVVGVIDSDIGISGGDLKASERSFQLLYQVSGRAGREEAKGTVYLQSFNPESKIISFLQEHNFDEFTNYELQTRLDSKMPPISRMVAVLVSGSSENIVMSEAQKIVRMSIRHDSVRILGPAPSLLSKLQNRYRYRILYIADKKIDIQSYISSIFSKYKAPSSISIKIDIDPYSMV